MSFLKQLLTPFVEFDEQKNKEEVTPKKPVTKIGVDVSPGEVVQHPLINPGNTSNATSAVPVYSPGGTIAVALPEHEQYFEKLINDANVTNPMFKGSDYKEFVDGKLDIDDITDEAIKYKTAFNVLKSTGLTKEKLFSTGQEYLNIIGRDLNAFQSAHSNQYNKEVKNKELQIQKKTEELQAVNQRINALKSEINQLSQDISVTKDKLNLTKNSFLLAGEKKQAEIQAELEKIAQFF